MFGFCESHARNLSPYDLAVLMVRRVMGLMALAFLCVLLFVALRYLNPLIVVVASVIVILGMIWVVHHEQYYAKQLVDWWQKRFV